MASWTLIPCLVRLRAEFDAMAPNRDRASDGSKGDDAHAASVSDHNPDETGSVPIRDADRVNEVHAIDVDEDFRVPGLSMEAVVQFLLKRCRSGQEKRLRYIIYERRIWEAGNGWKQRTYTGQNPHDKHAHFSASYESAREASTASWHLEDIPVALTASDKTWIRNEIRAAVAGLLTTDADPGSRNYSLGGMLTVIEKRTDQLANVDRLRIDRMEKDLAVIRAAVGAAPAADA